jgi:hypothetical protein
MFMYFYPAIYSQRESGLPWQSFILSIDIPSKLFKSKEASESQDLPCWKNLGFEFLEYIYNYIFKIIFSPPKFCKNDAWMKNIFSPFSA